jgi:hypothetical protein
MKNLKQPTGQVARWLEVLGTYDPIVKHPGLQHRNGDALSRSPCSKCAKQESNNALDEPQADFQNISSHHTDKSSDKNNNDFLTLTKKRVT